MDRRSFLRGAALAGVGAVVAPMLSFGRCRLFGAAGPLGGAQAGPLLSTRAIDLVGRTTVVDMLGLLTLDWPRLWRWQRDPASFGAADLARLRAAGVDVFHPAVDPNQPDPELAVTQWLDGWDRLLAQQPGSFRRIESVADMVRAKGEGRIGLLVGFQCSDHFRSAADVARFHRRGQRVSQLTYNDANALGSGCKAAVDRGLTPLGGEVVAEMNRLGMVVDVSHCGERTTLDAFAASRQPVLVTHSNCLALVPGQPRCKSDAVLRAMAAQGGVIGITAVRAFVGAGPTRERLLDHFEHVARLVGVEHVGLGSDVDVDARDPRTGGVRPAYAIRGLDQSRRVFEVADGLLRRGFAEADVELVLGGNFRRALAAIWGEGTDAPPRPGVVPPPQLAVASPAGA